MATNLHVTVGVSVDGDFQNETVSFPVFDAPNSIGTYTAQGPLTGDYDLNLTTFPWLWGIVLHNGSIDQNLGYAFYTEAEVQIPQLLLKPGQTTIIPDVSVSHPLSLSAPPDQTIPVHAMFLVRQPT